MFSSFGMGSTVDEYTVELTYEGVRTNAQASSGEENVEQTSTTVSFETKDDPEEVIDKLLSQRQQLPYAAGYDVVVVNMVYSATAVTLQLGIEKYKPKPVGLKVSSSNKTSTGKAHPSLVTVLKHCQLGSVRTVQLHDGLLTVLLDVRDKWTSVRTLDISNNALESVPKDVLSRVPYITTLKMNSNKLTVLPNLNQLTMLKELYVNGNMITAIPIDLCADSHLEVLSLECNRLTKLHIKLKDASRLRTLRLLGNAIEVLPQMHQFERLECFSLTNVFMAKNPKTGVIDVEVRDAGSSYLSSMMTGKATHYGKAYNAFLGLVFRSSECQNSFLVEALATIASMHPQNCEAIVNDEGAVNQLLQMIHSSNDALVHHASRALAQISKSAALARRLCDMQLKLSMTNLIQADNKFRNKCGLIILNNLIGSSFDISRDFYSNELIEQLTVFAKAGDEYLRTLSLRTVGTFAFDTRNRQDMLKLSNLHALLINIALRPELITASQAVRRESTRVLAILGENELVRQAARAPPITGRGVRILAMDGGGIRGRATVKMLKRIEEGTGRPIHESFDLVCGTSTGAILAVASCVKKFPLEHCDDIYIKVGRRIFNQTSHEEETSGANSWLGSVGSMYTSGKQQLLATTLYSSKHDTSTFETLVRKECQDSGEDPSWIDSAALGGPKVCCVSTLTSTTPAAPYLFRNYEYPTNTAGEYTQRGSCNHLLWEGVCASAAAPYYLYLDAFAIDSQRWVDGAMTCNNPAMLAVAEARRLWPDKNIECVVSLGSGEYVPRDRDPPISLVALAKDVLFESACDTERVHESLSTLLPLIPGARYFRFNPVDERCKVEVDETENTLIQGLLDATNEYIEAEKEQFDEVCGILRDPDDIDEVAAKLLDAEIGSRRGVMVIDSPRFDNELSECSAIINDFCSLRSIALKSVDCSNIEAEHVEGSGSVSKLHEALMRGAPNAGVIHFNCHSDVDGLVLAWQKDMTAIAEPSAIAELFLQMSGTKFNTIEQLCDTQEHVEVQGILHTFAGKHVQVNELGERASAYMFKRTVPAEYLNNSMSRELFSLWRDKIIVSQASLPAALIAVWLEAGAKCVVAPGNVENRVNVGYEQNEFMAAFYHALFVVGADATAAMSAAALVQPAAAYFRCYVLADGLMRTLRPDEDFDFALDAHV